jgi:6-phosphogluconolactonase
MIVRRHDFASREALAAQLARDVALFLKMTIQNKSHATLAVSGGTTPRLFFETLSHQDVDWAHVTLTLVDERQVDETSPRSNARLVREHLLKNHAAAARFVPLFQNLKAAELHLDAVVLGMGNDGHTASFFPGGDTLNEAIDPATSKRLMAISAPGAGEPRLTFTLPVLLDASFLALHIEGDDKKAVLDKALAAGLTGDMPVRAILRSSHPVTVYWAK